MSDSVDVIVLGSGNAALSAAMAAAEEGASVAIVEAAPKEKRGGNSRFTGALFRTVFSSKDDILAIAPDADLDQWHQIGEPIYSAEDYWADLIRLTGGKADVPLTETYINASLDTMLWLSEVGGVQWGFTPLKWQIPTPGAVFRAVGLGAGLVEKLFSKVEEQGVSIHYETEAFDWERDGDTIVLHARQNGIPITLTSSAIVLACGGFEADIEKRSRYLGANADALTVRGTLYNRGLMHEAALRHGAVAAGQWSGCHATPVDADRGDSVGSDASRHSFPFSVMLNSRGQRFVDEGEDFSLFTYAKMGSAILRQPGNLAVQVFDGQTIQFIDERYDLSRAIVGQSIAEFTKAAAERLGWDPAVAAATLEEFNAAAPGSAVGDPLKRDGKRTEGLVPEKTNWASRLEKPPFYGFPIKAGITFTYGGITIDTDAHVLNSLGEPIEGVFAAGEITGGFFYDNYPAGAGLMRGSVFGRAAGVNAVREIRSGKPAVHAG